MSTPVEFTLSLDTVDLVVVVTSATKGCSPLASRYAAASDQDCDHHDDIQYYVDRLFTFDLNGEVQQEMFPDEFLTDEDHEDVLALIKEKLEEDHA